MAENTHEARISVLEEKMAAIRIDHNALEVCKLNEIRDIREKQARLHQETNEKLQVIIETQTKQQGFFNGAKWGAGILFTCFLGLISGAWTLFTHFSK